MHLKIDKLPQIIYMIVCIVIWSYDRFARLARVVYRNCGRRVTRFRVQALPGGGGACRVDIEMPRPWKYTPGSHAYVYLPRVSLWMSHPFSIAWSNDNKAAQLAAVASSNDEQTSRYPLERRDSSGSVDSEGTISSNSPDAMNGMEDIEKMTSTSVFVHRSGITPVTVTSSALADTTHSTVPEDIPWTKRNTMSMVMSRRTGMTDKLFQLANSKPNKTVYLYGALEGEYGAQHGLNSYGQVVLIAGGVGITHCIGWARELLTQWKEGGSVAQKVILIWVIPDRDQYEWCREWFDQIFAVPGWQEFLSIQLYVSRPKGPLTSPCTEVPAFAGRPDWKGLFDSFVDARLGTMGVTVCGPGTLSDSIRLAVRQQVHKASIDFLEESFTW